MLRTSLLVASRREKMSWAVVNDKAACSGDSRALGTVDGLVDDTAAVAGREELIGEDGPTVAAVPRVCPGQKDMVVKDVQTAINPPSGR